MYAWLVGRHDWRWAAVVLVVAWCPLTWATVRSANTSGVSALMVGLTLYGLVTRRSALTAVAFYTGAALKFATVPLLLIPVVYAQTRTLAACVAVSVVLTAGCVALTGFGLWQEYFALLPTLGRPNPYPVNFSALGLINQFVPADYLKLAQVVRHAASVAVLAAVLVGLFRNRHRADAGLVLAGGSASLGWYLVFAPTTQNHYFAYLFPLWGYYVAESRHSWAARLAAVVVIGATIVPFGGGSRELHPVVQSHMLFAAVGAALFGIARLYQPGRPPHREAEANTSGSVLPSLDGRS